MINLIKELVKDPFGVMFQNVVNTYIYALLIIGIILLFQLS